MLQDFWPGDSSFFVDMTDDKNSDIGTFCQTLYFHRTMTKLCDITRLPFQVSRERRLDTIHNDQIWFDLCYMLIDLFQLHLTDQPKVFCRGFHPVRSQFDLFIAFLTTDI